MSQSLWSLPTKPGTVIAIGAWWFVALEPFEGRGGLPAWELLPAASHRIRKSMERVGFKQQCVYSNETVLIEAQQEGGYFVIAEPVSDPYGPHIRRRPAEVSP